MSPVGLGSGTATHSTMDRETKSGGASIPGCPACRKRINTLDQFFRHQTDDVLPVILRKAFEIAGVSTAE